ncbi:nitrate- and nitrite sensing domain-containing protein [Actinomadura miaoliensis]|uniref:histidine kinase n=1 Tax=Actinomadura miaoliensis TaxID=430685 RepID=A0ABP7WUH7_9ACTN
MRTAEGAEVAPQSPRAAPTTGKEPQRKGGSGGWLRLRNWRVTTRLIAVIAIPTVVAAVLAGGRVLSSVDNAEEYRRSSDLATVGSRLSVLSQALENERDAMAERAAGGARAVDDDTLRQRQSAVDAAAREYRQAVADADISGTQLRLGLANIDNRVRSLGALRALAGRLAPGPVVDKYSEFNDDILAHLVVAAYDASDPDTARSLLTLVSLSRAKDAASRERALIAAALWDRRFDSGTLQGVQDARSDLTRGLADFRASANLAEQRLFDDTVTGPELDRAEFTRAQALTLSARSTSLSIQPLGPRQAEDWVRDSTARIDRMQQVETRMRADVSNRVDELRSDAEFATVRDAVLLALLLAVVLIVVVVVARSMVRPLRRLQEGALEVAGTRLPGLVDRLRDPQAAAEGIEVEPIDVESRDEIGQVARAFDEVHREAVRLAADEAVLRGNINAMFVNLSRRSQTLIERQLRLIEELEQSERDEEQLANLFRLDHLATRMRRNCENLLVLGGQDQVRRWNRPVPLIDVVRASLSEVEQYERVAVRVQGDMTVAGPVVNDLVHLLAELVENATTFSAEHTKVTVSGQLLSGGGAMLQINDNGVGMSSEELEQANWRLANPPVIDFSAARRMGLFVVGRLAVRHGIRVELRAAQGGGLTAFVMLPDAVISAGESGGVGTRGFGSRDAEPAGRPQLAGVSAQSALAGPGGNSAGGMFQRAEADDPYNGTGGQPMLRGTGPLPTVGGTGPQPGPQSPTGPQPVAGTGPHGTLDGTGPHPMAGGTGPQPPLPGQTGPQPAFGNTGPLPMGGEHEPKDPYGVDARDPYGADTRDPYGADARDPYGAEDRPGYGAEERPGLAGDDRPGFGGDLPVRKPGAHLHGPEPVVPEAQPAMPEQSPPRQVSWDTGPMPPVRPGRLGRPTRRQPGDQGQPVGGGQWEDAPSPEPAAMDEPSFAEGPYPEEPFGQGAPPPAQTPPAGQMPPAQAAPAPSPEQGFGQGRPRPAARPPQRGSSAPPDTMRPSERSPIFDAMQSEWFQRRTEGASGDPAKGWESPADEGFRVAEAATRKPVAGSRTSAGLPKRVPGRNRVPGAVSPQEAAARREQAQSQSADVVRNRFASLQRGVRRGRDEARGAAGSAGTHGEGPSQDGGETGGTP